MLLSYIKKEILHFKKLSTEGQKLIGSFSLFSVAMAVLGIFLNAYLWRTSQDMLVVAFYNLSFCLALPFGFYLNGILLNKVKVNYLYFAGCLIQGIILAVIILLKEFNYPIVVFFGFIDGFGSSFFWANRTYFTFRHTDQKERMYFNSLESSTDSIIGIVIPFFVGWFIILGSKYHLYSVHNAYIVTSLLSLIALISAGSFLLKIDLGFKHIKSMFLDNPSPSWNKLRLITVLTGISSGITFFIPTLIILTLLGQEGVFGTIQSVIGIIGAIVLYAVGRKVSHTKRFGILVICALLSLIGSIALLISFTPSVALFFIATLALIIPLGNVAYLNVYYELMDEGTINHSYSYIFDGELYLNLGRVLGIISFLIVYLVVSAHVALQFVPLIGSLVQIPLIVVFYYLEKGLLKK